MILDIFDNCNLNPTEWEDLCDSCYSIRYPGRWHKIPADYLGDCGIEGYTDDGIVYQCYCPEQPYANDQLYEHQRNKLTTDIAKMINATNIPKLIAILGPVVIKEWHLVVPEYRGRLILEHANRKREEILTTIRKDPSKYPHLDLNLKISVMQANCYIEEISKTIRAKNGKIKLRLDLDKPLDYSSCAVDKVANITRKLTAIQPNLPTTQLNKIVNTYIEKYMEGVEKLNKLRIELPSEFAELHKILIAYKTDVEMKTSLNANSSMNYKVFEDIMNDFQSTLNQLGIFDQSTILNLKHEVIAGWLADCSMEFMV